MSRFDADLNKAVAALDAKFINMDNVTLKNTLHKGLIDMIENTIHEAGLDVYEELSDWCITYCKIKYKSSHPLNRFFKM